MIPKVQNQIDKPFPMKRQKAHVLLEKFLSKYRCAIGCSFGKDSTVVLHMALQFNPDVLVVFNNTGVEYPATIKFKEKLKKEWNLNLVETNPKKTFWKCAEEYGLSMGKSGSTRGKRSNQCCYWLKEKPMARICKEQDIECVITGITASESRNRMFLAYRLGCNYRLKDGTWKLHPIMYWTDQEVWGYIKKQGLPYNRIYDKINRCGCMPCTAYLNWKENLAKTNRKMYQFIQEKFFNQRLLKVDSKVRII